MNFKMLKLEIHKGVEPASLNSSYLQNVYCYSYCKKFEPPTASLNPPYKMYIVTANNS